MSSWKVGVQLYTLRDETSKDFVGALRKVAEEGFAGVEFAGYGGLEAGKLKELLDELGLQAIGSHVGIGRLKDALDEEIAFNKTIGSSYIVCPGLGKEYRDSEEAWKATFKLLEEIGRKCAEQGIGFGYHNHAFELEEKVGGEWALDALFGSTSADTLKVELDSAWVHAAGLNSVGYIGRYAGRLPLVHFKDLRRGEDGKWQTVELGTGEVDLLAIAKAADEAGTEWLIYEQDQTQNPPFVALANSMKWIKENRLA
ncbi:sugar phosphate isomerase/epimerase [Paenibacillus hemerocallicola]|uniref:Sugar phosphate isomerase/epimerase n=1 Tax=Paenibacillus hemerocallicola TaxID=1172614 RepID=A0A5C4TCR7_9BACL|nr:sugar phosphate isomerase/epimerase [Paenibacillus hemerocallicola]TNJ66662.1 sugar phosphate isomerase/epimerase [Paenibacillus hemerocallicola]